MALSDYNTLALNEKGVPINGVIETPLGVQAEIYKNWVYIRDAKAWREGGNFVEPTVMELTHGLITYQDLHVLALRGPQNGVYVVAWYHDEDYKAYGMIGCGTNNYIMCRDLTYRFTGTLKSSVKWFHKELNKTDKSWSTSTLYRNGKAKRSKQTFTSKVYDIPEVFWELDLTKCSQFNQGTAFMVANLRDRGL